RQAPLNRGGSPGKPRSRCPRGDHLPPAHRQRADSSTPRLRTSRPAAPDARRTSAGTRTLTSARTHCPARVHARKDRSAGLSRCQRYPSGPEDVVHAPALAQRLAGGPGHPFGGRPGGRHPVWTRLGPHLHEDGRGPVQYSRKEMADSGGSSSSCYEPCLDTPAVLKNKHIMIDLGTGNNNKINWAMEDKQEMIDIIETVYRGARKGRGLVVSPKDYSTKYRY
uniref:Thioredoxin like 4A n=1 Tax=Felis catus TaxID=9685 RepID=A0ABI7VST8_FELCA